MCVSPSVARAEDLTVDRFYAERAHHARGRCTSRPRVDAFPVHPPDASECVLRVLALPYPPVCQYGPLSLFLGVGQHSGGYLVRTHDQVDDMGRQAGLAADPLAGFPGGRHGVGPVDLRLLRSVSLSSLMA